MNPRICYNVDPDCDIFDHQRVAYCERLQVGMDAYGFTTLVGNNTLLRARALQEVGWFPTHTLTESWELGMVLVRALSRSLLQRPGATSYLCTAECVVRNAHAGTCAPRAQRAAGWKSRYVAEYSAIGEAPTEIIDSMERHYRDSRGHFQTFWSYQCPLLQRDLGLFYRLMYASEAFKNFASGARRTGHSIQAARVALGFRSHRDGYACRYLDTSDHACADHMSHIWLLPARL